ncbi:hypothetical protein [Microbacterium paludicola]|uniref:hypothetical protein n=1 Tax=Microbacterium paludicola TaxID=300019 RepID=UPI00119D3F99|nr:hypothetical protein [Microbacterium paludicola]
MTRHSEHAVSVALMNSTGGVITADAITAQVSLSEARFPYGEVTITVPLPTEQEALESTNPRHGDVRLLLDMRESVGDPVRAADVTAEHGGSVESVTTMFAGGITAVTERYFAGWNSDDTRGSALRGNFVVVSREIDHVAGTVTYQARTDEALATAYRLLSTTSETSGSLQVRATVNYALAKIGAVLVPGVADASIDEPDAIVWEPGTSAWDYIRNVAEAAGLVVRCDERRRWTLTRRDAVLDTVVSLNRHIRVRERIDLTGDTFADGIVIRYGWRDAVTGDTRVRYDTASTGAESIKVIRIERDVPYPGPGAAAYWLNRLAARGRVFDIDQVSDYSIRPGTQFTTAVPLTPAQVGHVESVEWALPERVMTITTIGSTDSVDGAIDLFTPGLYIDDLVGFINDLDPSALEAA